MHDNEVNDPLQSNESNAADPGVVHQDVELVVPSLLGQFGVEGLEELANSGHGAYIALDGKGIPYGVPCRVIEPKESQCTNLLVALCFSASYIAYASSRMEPVFMVMGESAGVASAQALDQQTDVQKIDVSRLQKSLSANR